MQLLSRTAFVAFIARWLKLALSQKSIRWPWEPNDPGHLSEAKCTYRVRLVAEFSSLRLIKVADLAGWPPIIPVRTFQRNQWSRPTRPGIEPTVRWTLVSAQVYHRAINATKAVRNNNCIQPSIMEVTGLRSRHIIRKKRQFSWHHLVWNKNLPKWDFFRTKNITVSHHVVKTKKFKPCKFCSLHQKVIHTYKWFRSHLPNFCSNYVNFCHTTKILFTLWNFFIHTDQMFFTPCKLFSHHPVFFSHDLYLSRILVQRHP